MGRIPTAPGQVGGRGQGIERPFVLRDGTVVEQPPNTRRMRDDWLARAGDLAWTGGRTEDAGWKPVRRGLLGTPAGMFRGIVRPNDKRSHTS